MSVIAPKLNWCIVRIGNDFNWWVKEISDPIHWDLDSLSILDPKQVSYILDLTNSLQEYGLNADLVDRAFFRFRRVLHTGDQAVFQRIDVNGFIGDFPQGDDGVFIVVAVDGNGRTRRNVFRALSRQQHQFKTIGNFFNAVFNGNSCHNFHP